jgi:hypothetical protein
MAYNVRRTQSSNGTGDLLVDLWRRNLQMRGNPRDKFDWYYRSNPVGAADAFLLEHVEGESAAVVGCCGIGRRRLFVDGAPVVAGLFADFAVDKAHRTTLPALKLQRALCEYGLSTYPLTYGFPNEAAVGLFGRIGFPVIGRMSRYVRVLRFAGYLRKKAPRPLSDLAAAPLDISSLLYHGAKISRRGPRLTWVTDVDERFDDLAAAARSRYRVLGDRSQEFLRWKYLARPNSNTAIAALVDPGNGAIDAYAAVVTKEPGVATIADFLGRSPAAVSDLLIRLAPALRSRGFSAAATVFLGDPEIGAALTKAGYSRRGPGKFVVAARGREPGFGEDVTKDAARMYFTDADRDN